MKALTDFLTTDYGLLSAAVIPFTLGMGAFIARFFASRMKEDERRMRATVRQAPWRLRTG